MIKIILKGFTSIVYFLLYKAKLLRCFSQEGEDLVIDRILKFKNIKYKDLFFLDIGAGHPIKYSNTFYFYIRGSKGISIDAFNKNIKLHKVFRPKDISLNLLLGKKSEIKDYYVFNQSELNTISKKRLEELKKYNISPLFSEKVDQFDSSLFFKENIKDYINNINFFTIDIEGAEVDVLNSINWEVFKPEIICVEMLSLNFDDIFEHEVYKILKSKGYNIYSKLVNSVIWLKN